MKALAILFSIAIFTAFTACNQNNNQEVTTAVQAATSTGGEENVQDDESEKNVVKVGCSIQRVFWKQYGPDDCWYCNDRMGNSTLVFFI